MEAGNGVKTAYTYHAETRRLNALSAGRANGNRFQNLAYAYDKVGNILKLENDVDIPPASTFGGPTTQSFVYDELYRLTQAQGSFQFAPGKTHVYTLEMGYDSIHNIKTKQQVHNLIQPSGVAVSQKKTSYDWSYLYQGPQPHAPTHIGERTFTYDLNGNQTGFTHDRNGTNRTIVWNEENRVESIADQGHTKTYKYDDQGTRTIKRGPQGETVYVNQFFTQRPGATGTKHVYAGTSRIVSKLMRQDTPGANPQGRTPFEKDLYFFHPDHLGTSNYITDTNGKLYEHLEYFPFGEAWVEESSNTQRAPYLFTAKELDEETGLYYFGARYYDPRTSVWQSADPILEKYLPNFEDGRQVAGAAGGVFESSTLGLYTYGRNNPIVLKDPDGNIVPILLAAWAIYEVASAGYDIYNAGKTLADPNATAAEKSIATGGALLSIVAPGGGYGTAGRLTTRALKEGAEQGFKSFTRANMRENLMRLTGKTAADVAGKQAHHVLPVALQGKFAKAGINIHDPRFGAWVGKEHQSWSKAFQKDWEGFFEAFGKGGKSPTARQILEKAQELSKKYGFDWKPPVD